MPAPLDIQQDVTLAPYTTFGIGGPARWFAEARSEDDVAAAVAFAGERGVPLFVLGGGSNLLVADEGFDGLVLHIALQGIAQSGNSFTVGAGENWDAFVAYAVEHELGGIECLAGIPGTVGGTPVQNVGAYGQEVSHSIERLRAFDRVSGRFIELRAEDCGFGYRSSTFNTSQRDRYIISEVTYGLFPSAEQSLGYADLKSYFKDWEGRPTLAQTAEAVRQIRHRKGMLLVAGEPDCRSAGSFFKNPVVGMETVSRVAKALAIDEALVPRYDAPGRNVKLPAAWLLEKAGFHKGYTMGAAGISTRHTLALTNRSGATAADVLALRDRIVEAVEQRFSIRLEQEPVLVG